MSRTKIKSLQAVDTKNIFTAVIFSVAILFIPQLISNQIIAGSIVNAIFVFSLLIFGYQSVLVLCFIPSLVALSSGLLPVVMAPMLPFIMLANVVYISILYYYTKSTTQDDKTYAKALLLASVAKFAFLFVGIKFLSQLVFEGQLAEKLLLIFSWPQLLTAVIGGILTFAVIKFLGVSKYPPII